jgi:2-oxoglutarate dehydrogenase E2 component (dihydrolipoamide succinyltransferase)
MIDLKVPQVGESITEVTIANWLKKDGDYCKMDEPVCEIESDKATVEVAAAAPGVLKIKVAAGTTIEIGKVIAQIDETATAPAASASAQAPASAKVAPAATVTASNNSDKNFPSPAAKKILDEKGVAADFAGSGKDGRITKEDAMKVAPAAKATGSVSSAPVVFTAGARDKRREKMTTLRKAIAKRLLEAKHATAMLTTFNEIDMSALMDLRKKYKEAFKEKHNVNLGFMSFFTKACCMALRNYPAVNAQIDGDEIVYHDYCDVGVAVSTPKGLMVPVVRNAESMSLADIEKSILNLATKARDGKITIDDMSGGTFTITNGGVFGSMLSTPILNHPQVAILGMHNIVERPVAVNGQVVIRPIMMVALSYDHRVIDGRESVSFLKTVKELIEDPSRLLLEV